MLLVVIFFHIAKFLINFDYAKLIPTKNLLTRYNCKKLFKALLLIKFIQSHNN